jgi:hypothetical protein
MNDIQPSLFDATIMPRLGASSGVYWHDASVRKLAPVLAREVALCTPVCAAEHECTQPDAVPVDRKSRNAAAMRERRAAQKAGVSVAELRQRQAIAASPNNVVALKPKGASTTAPTLEAPEVCVG